METVDLRTLRAELLLEQIGHTKAERRLTEAAAKRAEIELLQATDVERDRQAKPGLNRRLNFFGPLTEDNVDATISNLEHWEARDPAQPITITFNCPGGSVIDGFALYDTIQRLRRKGHYIVTRATGMAASMGGILLQAGDERIMDARCFLLIHEVSGGSSGKVSLMEDEVIFMKKLQDAALEILASRSTMTKAQIARKWKKTDWWLSSAEALQLGFVDRVE